jgi:6-phosphofructokinase
MRAGGNAAANAIHEECRAQHLPTSIVGVPKSIDNDIQIIDRCFGYESAVDEAQRALLAAKVEARSALRCDLPAPSFLASHAAAALASMSRLEAHRS